jgi:uncharacterized protein (DUF4415 family)
MVGFHHLNTEPIMNLERKIDMTEEIKKRKGRGKGKNPPMVSTSIRLTNDIVEYFKGKYPQKWQSEMRKVLINFIKGEANGS